MLENLKFYKIMKVLLPYGDSQVYLYLIPSVNLHLHFDLIYYHLFETCKCKCFTTKRVKFSPNQLFIWIIEYLQELYFISKCGQASSTKVKQTCLSKNFPAWTNHVQAIINDITWCMDTLEELCMQKGAIQKDVHCWRVPITESYQI